jgi:PAS domain-containing protein
VERNGVATETASINIQRMERREWFLWFAAVLVTLLLTAGLASFLLREEVDSSSVLPQAVRGLVALVLIFNIYTLYQQLQINRMRRKLVEGEELFRLITENAADMIAVVDMEGHRILIARHMKRSWDIQPPS